LKVKYEDETAQTIISGMGELHLEIIVDRLTAANSTAMSMSADPESFIVKLFKRRWKLKEYLKRNWAKRNTSVMSGFLLSPRKRGSGNEIINKIDDSIIPAEYYDVIEEGIREAMMNGVSQWLSGNRCRSDDNGRFFPGR
jgi:elongation factor G